MARKLRTVSSIVCGILCLLLIVLWVRSYQTLDNLSGHIPTINAVSCTSAYGRIVVGTRNPPSPQKLKFHSAVLDGRSFGGKPKEPRKWFYFQRKATGSSLQVPHGFLAFNALVVAVSLWLPTRFSLRTLLIATTLVAVGLGFVVALS